MGHGTTAETTAETTPEKQSKQLLFGCFGCFPAVFRLFYRDPLATLFGCFSAVGNLAPLQVAAEIAIVIHYVLRRRSIFSVRSGPLGSRR